jgi:tRNA(His) 5'-end guanylyltransferase
MFSIPNFEVSKYFKFFQPHNNIDKVLRDFMKSIKKNIDLMNANSPEKSFVANNKNTPFKLARNSKINNNISNNLNNSNYPSKYRNS